MLHLYLQLCWAGECLQPALISSQYQNRRQNTWAATLGTRGHSAGRHSRHGGSVITTIAVKKYTESKGRNIAFCTMHQCTLHTMHQCSVLLCVAVSSAAPLICYQPSAPPSNTPPSTAVETASNQRGLSAVCTLAHLTIRPSFHRTKQSLESQIQQLPRSVVRHQSVLEDVDCGHHYNINCSICLADEAWQIRHSPDSH